MLRIPPFCKLIVAAFLLTVVGTSTSVAASNADFQLTRLLEKEGFSGTVRVETKGKRIYLRHFGSADYSFGTPVNRKTRFHIASITKLFTSVLILQLAEEGRLDLDAPFVTYLKKYPGSGADEITVRQLLGHMSGLPQFDTAKSLDDALLNGLPQYQLPRTPYQLLELCCSKMPETRPGARFDYNNADYMALGQVIETLTGETYAATLNRKILKPLGMTETNMSDWRKTVPNLARTYFRASPGDEFLNELPVFWENWYAAGGMYSTSDDLARFAAALFNGKLLKPASMHELLTPGGDEYGLGLWSYSITRKGKQYRVAKRPGSIMGANTMLYVLPEHGLSIVMLANSNAVDLDNLAQDIADAFIERKSIR